MKPLNYSSFAFGLVSGAAASGLAIILKIIMNKRKELTDCILISPQDTHYSRSAGTCENLACPLCGYNKLCALLRTTQSQLDLCMYLITEPLLANLILRLHKRGVSIRIITDKQMSDEAYKCKSGLFVKHQIPMKCVESRGMMHNKFCIIDQKLVITGSCNWTQQGFTSNFENVVIIQKEEISEKYYKYFNELWSCEKYI